MIGRKAVGRKECVDSLCFRMLELKKIKNEVASEGLFDCWLNKNQRTLNQLLTNKVYNSSL